jgi:hypothetical protein
MQYLSPPFTPLEHSTHIDASAPFPCRWILARLNATCATVNSALESYDFSTTTQTIYSFWQYDVCDTFIELIKPAMRVRPLHLRPVLHACMPSFFWKGKFWKGSCEREFERRWSRLLLSSPHCH